MEHIANELLKVLEQKMPSLLDISEEASELKLGTKWSKKEILGHLIDSACNNQQKFVRTMQSGQHSDFTGYDQDFWVKAQGYQKQKWKDLLLFWELYNRHLACLIRQASGEHLQKTISIDGGSPLTLAFIMADYVEHLKHHLRQILPSTNHTMS
ncbi:MAG: DinB family protein [Saprospiraceae bacterium]|nr:DinB family protein [Saprospiraceae bacterium]